MAKMHELELSIDEQLVRGLIASQCPQWAHLPLKTVASIGTDHTLFRLGSVYLVRLPRIYWAAESIDAEYEWLSRITQFLSTPISLPVFKGSPTAAYPWPWLVVIWNEGHNPSFERDNEYEELAKDLAQFLNQFYRIKLDNGPYSRRGIPLMEQDAETRTALSQLVNDIDVQSIEALWNELTNVPAWSKEPVWVHGDFLPGNILIQNDRLSAVIDFSIMGIGDPACDLIIAWSLFNEHSRSVFRAHLEFNDEDTWQRGRGWALSIALIMLPYYKTSNPALATLARRMIENIYTNH